MHQFPEKSGPTWLSNRIRPIFTFLLVALCLAFLATPRAALHAPQGDALRRVSSAQITFESSPDGVWRSLSQGSTASAQPQRPDILKYLRLGLNRSGLTAILREAPMEFSAAAAREKVILTLPTPDGSFNRFAITESPIMAPELAKQFPEIRTYMGQGLDDPTATTRFDWTPQGFHAIVLRQQGTVFIEPEQSGSENYIAYFQKDAVGSPECDVPNQPEQDEKAGNPQDQSGQPLEPAVTSGSVLRTYRLAVAATAEYVQTYGGGTVSGGLSAVTTTVNLINAIYEKEVAIRLILIGNETSIIFTDTATDGYTTDITGALYNENQTKLDTVIGAANYDIGHVFDGRPMTGGTGVQGMSGVGSLCSNGQKAHGVDIFRNAAPGSVFAITVPAHEFGHQFGATHSFNVTTGLCSSGRSAQTAYEPDSGSTLMAYPTVCAPFNLNSGDMYFHIGSIEQIVNLSNSKSCGTTLNTGNTAPFIDAGPAYTIPMGTPFTLTALGGDPDGDALTFGWEEFDLGAASPPETDDGSRPLFRSFTPATDPARTFPRLADILSGTSTLGESLPTTTRTMNFRVTARDNRADGGGINSAATKVNVRADSGPFTVTSPAGSSSLSTGSQLSVNWTVARTDLAPVNCASVRITLSIDGGATFPIILANDTPNDGAETVTLPGTPTADARVRVEATGNIFFNISSAFTITGSANTAPNISGLSPGSGAPGATITINGVNFISPTSVSFNGVNAAFIVNSTTQMIATVPNGSTSGSVALVTPSGMAVSAGNFVVNMPTVKLSAAGYSISEAGPDASVVVTRSGDTSGTTTINYATSDTAGANCSASGGPASAHCDYLATIGTLHFAANETSKTISIPIVDDSYAEGSEDFTITLSDATGATPGAPLTATITIVDNDGVNGQNPLDHAAIFVRQQYIDFLNRDPDPSGLAFWTNEITSCGSDQSCIDVKRFNVSAAFFLSIEFQQTDYLVERFYKAAFGDSSGNSTIGGTHQLTVPNIRFNEFLPDGQQIGQGVVVNQTGWETVLENNKRNFTLEFVQRSRFVNAFPVAMTPAQFVDRLNQNAGNVLSSSERTTAIGQFGGANDTSNVSARARALRQVADDQDLYNAEFNPAFVLMQYFGYLRRNPNDAPDSDYAGYDFWLTKLNQFNGNFVNAEMVKAFVSSREYRQRFGP